MNAPILDPHIIVTDGILSMSDDSSLQEYLREWQKRNEHKDGTHVNVINNTTLTLWYNGYKSNHEMRYALGA